MTHTKPKRNRRWRLLADWQIQGILCLRLLVYWILCQLTMAGTMLGFAFMFDGLGTDSVQFVRQLIVPAGIVSFLLLPVMMLDMIAFSNRFAGPLLNFRRRLKELAENGSSEKLYFRAGDLLPDLAENFNALCELNGNPQDLITEKFSESKQKPEPELVA